MSTLREAVYLVMDELKNSSKDGYFENEHIIYLLSKYRAFILKQRYSDIRKQIPLTNYQTLCLNLKETSAGELCEGDNYLVTTNPIKGIMEIGNSIRVTSTDFWKGKIDYINRDRFRYVGGNKWLKNIIYASLGPDNYLYLKSDNPQYLYLEKIKVHAIFEDFIPLLRLQCEEVKCDILDMEFPIEAPLLPIINELVVKELLGPIERPKDTTNNSNDDLEK